MQRLNKIHSHTQITRHHSHLFSITIITRIFLNTLAAFAFKAILVNAIAMAEVPYKLISGSTFQEGWFLIAVEPQSPSNDTNTAGPPCW